MRGRRPDPKKLLLVQPGTPAADAEALRPPEALNDDGKEHWAHLIGTLRSAGVPIHEADAPLLMMACELWATMRHARRELDQDGYVESSQRGSATAAAHWRIYRDAASQYATVAQRLGLGPAERLRFPVHTRQTVDNGADWRGNGWASFRPLPRRSELPEVVVEATVRGNPF